MDRTEKYTLEKMGKLAKEFGEIYFKYEFCGIDNSHYIVVLSKEIYDRGDFVKMTWDINEEAYNYGITNFGIALGTNAERID